MSYTRLQPEAKFRNKVRAALKELPNTWFVKVQQVGILGTPDFLLCVNGRFVALELKKSSKDRPTKLQAHNLDKIKRAGGVAIVAAPDSFTEALSIISQLATTRL